MADNKQHYLILTADTNIHEDKCYVVFLNKDNKILSDSEKLAYNTTINISWSLLPMTTFVPTFDELTIIQDTDKYIYFQNQNNINTIVYKPIDVGDTTITVKSPKYGSASIKVRVKLIN